SQVAEVAKDAGIAGDYEQATRASNAINLAKLGAKNAESLEGFLFPATYELFRGAKVGALVEKQLDAFESNLAGIDMGFAKSQGLSVYDVVIIASMIEREIAVPEERKLAASVIYNRLEADDTLGIDATIRFEDQNYTKPLVQSRLDSPTPYNTRVNPGLPPGPIGNPGLASLEAAANPAKTDFYYFVVKPGSCNEHAFVETEAEFAAAEADYQAALEAQGGSPTDC
ncbi:MAG: endolytic transglycosylase MltG, partial [Actinomycetota bacterium]|nr:endolytic transglycosylase MltG [Actinomycetota bacterium]